MNIDGRTAWVPVGGEPRRGTVTRYTYAPDSGAPLVAVELENPVDGTESVVVDPTVDDVVFD